MGAVIGSDGSGDVVSATRSMGIARVFLGWAKAAHRQARAQASPRQEIGSCETGLSWGRLLIVRSSSFPGPRPDVHGPPSSAGFGISRVLGSAAPCGTPRIGAVVDQLALPNRVAPRPDRCGLVWNLCARRGTGCLCRGAICGRARTGWRVRSPAARRDRWWCPRRAESRRFLSTAHYGSRSGMVTVKPGVSMGRASWGERNRDP